MKYEIHYTSPSGVEDSIIIEGDTIEELRATADSEVEKRGGINPWSKCLDEEPPQKTPVTVVDLTVEDNYIVATRLPC